MFSRLETCQYYGIMLGTNTSTRVVSVYRPTLNLVFQSNEVGRRRLPDSVIRKSSRPMQHLPLAVLEWVNTSSK